MTSNVEECGAVVVDYLSTLARDFAVHPQGVGRCVLVTPFQRPDGESIEIEVSTLPDGRLRLSDMGQSIAYLYVNGLTVSRTTLDNARRLCRRHGIDLNRSELTVEAVASDTTGDSIHGLIQATITVSDLIQVRRPSTSFLFDEVVESFLVANRAVYDTDYVVQGNDSAHVFSFHVNSGRNLLIQPVTANQEHVAFGWAERWAYRLEDIRAHSPIWNPFMVLDDRGERARVWTARSILPLERHASVVRWSEVGPLAEALEASVERL